MRQGTCALQRSTTSVYGGKKTASRFLHQIKVVLPLIQPGLAAAAIFTFRVVWNEYLLASALSDRDTKTVPILIVNNMFEFNVEWGVIMATGMLLAIPPIIFTLLSSRQIITGMTAGAVKD